MKRTTYGVAIVVKNAIGQVLMQHRDDIPTIAFPDHWSVPSGGIKTDQSVTWDIALENAARELEEEIGLVVSHSKLRGVICETLEKPDFDLVRYVVEVPFPVEFSDLQIHDESGGVLEGQRWGMKSEEEIFSSLKVPPTIFLLLERIFKRRLFSFLENNPVAVQTFAGEITKRFKEMALEYVVADEATRAIAVALPLELTSERTGSNVLRLAQYDPSAFEADQYGALVTLSSDAIDAPRLKPEGTHLRFITPRSTQ